MSATPDFSAAMQMWAQAWQPQNEAATALQNEWRQRHTELWQAMLGRRRGDPSPTIAPAEPGDRRFDHPAWAESPIYDYLRQAYRINAEYLKKAAEAAPVTDGQAKD